MIQLNEKYNREDFLAFLNDFLPDFEKDIRKVNTSGLRTLNEAFSLGSSKKLDLQIFELTHSGSQNKRVALATDGFRIMKQSATFQALVIFNSSDSHSWRLSLMTATPVRNERGGVVVRLSNPKRYSFALGQEAKINTPYNFLIKKGKLLDFDDLQSRFSVEVVNKEFYKEIANQYTKLVGGVRGEGRNKQEFLGVIKLPSVPKENPLNQEFAVRMIGRIIFCWFLREKKSEAGLSLIPDEILSLDASNDIPDYYHSILEPLFFEILNKTQNTRKEKYQEKPYDKIPYLNGGLFSPQDDDYFNQSYINTLVIPDDWLRDFFEILERYNFTIDENTTVDIDLSIDPEMLGRIFENLLAEINPETGESARKSTGSYYTPRTIVEYMVDESLYHYLEEKTAIAETKLRALISYDLTDDDESPLSNGEKQKIIEALSTITILDPACGSGAFPIGALQKIVFMLQRLDPNGQFWFQRQIKNAAPEIKRIMEREFAHKNFDYIRKLGIIRESIFGVDIQPIATEIARLRCFLTLVVEERVADGEPNRGIEPLPNLDFKFVTANSLIGLSSTQQNGQTDLFEDQEGIDQLKEVREMYFSASGAERESLRTRFVQIQNKMFQKMIDHHFHADLTKKLSAWDPFGHDAAIWFDIDWMFGIKEGFDIVIGNPPYLRIQGIQRAEPELAQKYKEIFKSATGSFDLYVLFLERGLSLLNSKGILNYILPHKWTNSAFGKGIRRIIQSNNSCKKMISFGAHQIFSASNYTSLLWLTLKQNNTLEYFEFSKAFTNNSELDDALNKLTPDSFNSINSNSLDENPWVLTDSKIGKVLKKLSVQPLRVKDVFIKIFQGIATSKDSVYFLKDCVEKGDYIEGYSEDLAKSVQIEKGLVKPLLRGEQIHKYTKPQTNNYVIFPYHVNNDNQVSRVAKVMSPDFIKDNYPLGWKYLLSCEKTIKERERGRLSKEKDWYRYIYPKNISYFEQPKIITPEISFGTNMTLDNDGKYYHNTKCYSLIKNPNISSDYRFYLGILNSKLMWFFLNNTGYILRGGYFTFKTNYLEPFPLPEVLEPKNHDEIVKLVDDIYFLTRTSDNPETMKAIKDLEKQIDQIVYKLYGLTPEEIAVVEGRNI